MYETPDVLNLEIKSNEKSPPALIYHYYFRRLDTTVADHLTEVTEDRIAEEFGNRRKDIETQKEANLLRTKQLVVQNLHKSEISL